MDRFGFIHEKLDIKILILFILRRLPGFVEPETLLDLCQCDGGIGYFDYSDCLSELVETEHVEESEEGYRITEKGARNADAVESSLPYSVRTKCSRRLSKVNAALRRDAQVRSEILPRADGTCTLRLSLDDEEGNILTLELLSPSQAQSERLAEGFKARPEQIYNGVLDVLLAEADNADNKEREP